MYCFDKIVDRGRDSMSFSMKWQGYQGQYEGYCIDVDRAIPMWVADMDFPCPREVVEAVTRRAQHGIYGYTSPECTQDFLAAAADWIGRRQGWDVEAGSMIFSPGIVPAIYAAVQAFTETGDGIIVQSPVYYPFMRAAEHNKRQVVSNQLQRTKSGYEIDFAGLEELATDKKNRLMILSNPHNPVGRVWRREELVRILEICQAHDVVLFSDEIHCDLTYPHVNFTSLGAICKPGDPVIIAQAPSKTFNLAGLQASALVIPNQTVRQTLSTQYLMNRLPGSNAFGALAGAVAYRTGEAYLEELLQYLWGNMEYAAKELNQTEMAWMDLPEATYLAWVEFPGQPEHALNRLILEKAGVIGDIGTWFGPGGSGFMRLNLACPRSTVREAVSRINRVLCAG